MADDLNNVINLPIYGSPRFQSDTIKAIERIRASLGAGSAPSFDSIVLQGSTASRLVSTDADQKLSSVTDLTAWITGTANEVSVADDGDGTITIGIVDPLIVSKGGTGAATLTDHGILLGSGTDPVTALGVATNGQLPIGSTGADPVLATLTGTADEIVVTNGAGSITLSLDGSIGDIAGLTPADGNFIVGDGTNWVAESGNTVRTSLGLGSGDSPTFTGLTVDAGANPGTLATFKSTGDSANSEVVFQAERYLSVVGEAYRSGGAYAGFHSRRARGTIASPSAVQAGDVLSTLISSGYDGSGWVGAAAIYATVRGAVSSGRVSADLDFYTRPEGGASWLKRLSLEYDGGVLFPSLAGPGFVKSDGDGYFSGNNSIESTDLALTSWITGTANRVTVADDGDGTITLSGPQDIHTAASPTFAGLTVTGTVRANTAFNLNGTDGITVTDTVITALQDNAGQLQYKSKTITFTGGIRTATGAESAWTDVPSV